MYYKISKKMTQVHYKVRFYYKHFAYYDQFFYFLKSATWQSTFRMH